MRIDSESVAALASAQSARAQSVAADQFAAKQMQVMQEIIGGRNATQQAFIASHGDTHEAFQSMVSSLFASGSSHANEAARIAATVQDMRNAEKAYREAL